MDFFQYFWNGFLSLFGVTVASGTALPEDSNLSTPKGVRDYSPENVRKFVTTINGARSKVDPLAERMNFLNWDDELAKDARKLVTDCDYDYYGDNDVISLQHSEFSKGFSVRDLADSWISANYDVTTDVCTSSMKICNDFKLLTRDDSSKFGCATNACERKPGQKPVHVTACKFDQSLTSGPPYRKSNQSCTGCSADQKCFNNLCRNISHVDEGTTTAPTEATTIAIVLNGNETLPILVHGRPNLGNISHHVNGTNGTAAEGWQTIIQGRGVSWVAFIVLCVLLAITLVLAVWALAMAYRLKSKIPVDGKNF